MFHIKTTVLALAATTEGTATLSSLWDEPAPGGVLWNPASTVQPAVSQVSEDDLWNFVEEAIDPGAELDDTLGKQSNECLEEGRVILADDGQYYVDPACLQEKKAELESEQLVVEAVRCPRRLFAGPGLYCVNDNLHICTYAGQKGPSKVKSCSSEGCYKNPPGIPDTCKRRSNPFALGSCSSHEECGGCTAALGCAWDGSKCYRAYEYPRCAPGQGCANMPNECPNYEPALFEPAKATTPIFPIGRDGSRYPNYQPFSSYQPRPKSYMQASPFKPTLGPFGQFLSLTAIDINDVYGATLRPWPLAYGVNYLSPNTPADVPVPDSFV